MANYQVNYKGHIITIGSKDIKTLLANHMENGNYLANWWEGVCESQHQAETMKEMKKDILYKLFWKVQILIGKSTKKDQAEWEQELLEQITG